MLKFLRNKLLTTFMFLGALTQNLWAEKNYIEKDEGTQNSSQVQDNNRNHPSKTKQRDLSAEERRIAADDAEELTFMGIQRDKNWLERIISLEFAARYEEVAERAMMTKDRTELNKIRAERDEIRARRQKEWDEGTFDKVAEAKRWAAYLKKRAIDQTLVNYPVYVGEPPFPIDMSILDAPEQQVAKKTVVPPFSPDDIILKNDNKPLAGTKDVQELLSLLDNLTAVPGSTKDKGEEELPYVGQKIATNALASVSQEAEHVSVTNFPTVVAMKTIQPSTPQILKEEMEKSQENSEYVHNKEEQMSVSAVSKNTVQTDLKELLDDVEKIPDSTEKVPVSVSKSENNTQDDLAELLQNVDGTSTPTSAEKKTIATTKPKGIVQDDLEELLCEIDKEDSQTKETKPTISHPQQKTNEALSSPVKPDEVAELSSSPAKEEQTSLSEQDVIKKSEEETVAPIQLPEIPEVPSIRVAQSISTNNLKKIDRQEVAVQSNAASQKDLEDLLDAIAKEEQTAHKQTSPSGQDVIKKSEEKTVETEAPVAMAPQQDVSKTPETVTPVQLPEIPDVPSIQVAQNISTNNLKKIDRQEVAVQLNAAPQKDLDDLLNAIEGNGMDDSDTHNVDSQQITPPIFSANNNLDLPARPKYEVKFSQEDLNRIRAQADRKPSSSDEPENIDLNSPYAIASILGFSFLAAGALLTSATKKSNGHGSGHTHLHHHSLHSRSIPKVQNIQQIDDVSNSEIKVADTKEVKQEKTENILISDTKTLQDAPIQPIQHRDNMSQSDREFLAERLHAIRKMEDIKHKRRKLAEQMAEAKENNDEDRIKIINDQRRALTARRREAFALAAGPLLGQIRDERRQLTKKMTIARRRKDEAVMAEITKERMHLKLQEQALKLTVRSFKYKRVRNTFLNPTLVSKMKSNPWRKKRRQRTRV